jgi:hypothetical protein
LIVNQEAFWEVPEDRFKVWPTNRDRSAFNAVMRAESQVDYTSLPEPGSRLVQAHKYFAEESLLCFSKTGRRKRTYELRYWNDPFANYCR